MHVHVDQWRARRRVVVEELVALGAAVYTCSLEEEELVERLKEWQAMDLPVAGSVCDVSVRDQRERLGHRPLRRQP